MLENRVLQDGYGRRFHYLRLSITDVCNFRCGYCLPDGWQAPADGIEPPLHANEIAVLVAAFARLGTSKIRLTGGEPSLRQDLPALIALCKQTPGIRTVALTTNGYRLDKQIDQWHGAGLDAVNVSIDSLDRARFAEITGHDRLPTLLRGLDRAVALGIERVKVNAVLFADQHEVELARFLDWLKRMPLTLRFIELMRTGDNGVFFRRHHLRGDSVLAALQAQGWQEVVRRQDAGPARELWHPDYAGRIGFILPYSSDFCSSCNRLRVSASGKLHLCLFAGEGHDIREYCRRGDVDGLVMRLQELVAGKAASHSLHQGNTGATRHLAMLGG